MAAIESDSGSDPGRGHVGPGALLRKARENAGISLHDVAAQLHLDPRTIASLERDAFDELPAPTFVRGYLRGYARLLNVPVSPVMEAYNREGFHPPDLVADIAERPQAHSGDLPVRLLTYLIVVVLAGLVVWWWYDREMAAPSLIAPSAAPGIAVTEPASSGGETGTAPGGPGPAAPAAAGSTAGAGDPEKRVVAAADSTPLTPPSSRTVRPGAEDRPPLDINKRVESELAQVEKSLAGGAPGSATASTGATPAREGDTPEKAAAAPGAAEPSSKSTAAAAKARVRLEFPIEAWVEIHDRNAEKLFFNLVKPGRVLEVTGQAPIRILLGRSKGVTLQFNGEPVDLKPHVRKGGVAQLTLGQ